MCTRLIHIVLGLIAIGIALILWERFPAFKWIVFSGVVGFLLLVLIAFAINDSKKREREREDEQIRNELSQQRATPPETEKDAKHKKLSDDDPLLQFLNAVEKEEKMKREESK